MAKQSLATRATKPLVLTKLMLVGARTPRRQTPTDAGLEYESVTFPATDGVKLSGWFIPPQGGGPGARRLLRARLAVEPPGQHRRPRPLHRPRRRLPPRHEGAPRRGLPRAPLRPAPPRRE